MTLARIWTKAQFAGLPSPPRRLMFLAVVLAITLSAGCSSGPVAPALGLVKGKVTMDGGPAAGMSVIFEPENGRSSTGLTDKDGNYTLDFDPTHKGAMVGKHKVRMTKNIDADPVALMAAKGPPQPIPVRYNDKTTLEAEVKAGDNVLNFELTSAP
jgi:hypothetical protein